MTRTIATLRGRVQGVGFRYTVLEIARRHAVAGTVRNLRSGRELEVDAEGDERAVAAFLDDVLAHPPPDAHVESVERRSATPRLLTTFEDAPTA